MPFSSRPDDPLATSGISTGFPVLSRARGLVIHVLRTRAPLSSPKGFSFDLHVLGPPQTFALSQDQTLQFDVWHQMMLDESTSRPTRAACHSRWQDFCRYGQAFTRATGFADSRRLPAGDPVALLALAGGAQNHASRGPCSCSSVFRKRRVPCGRPCLSDSSEPESGGGPVGCRGSPGQGTRFVRAIQSRVKLRDEVFCPLRPAS